MAIEKKNPYEDANPFEVVQDIRAIVEDLKRALYGDEASRSPGMFKEMDALSKEVKALRQDLESVKSRKPNVGNWTVGYISFCASVIFAITAIVNQIPHHQVLNVPAEIAATFAAVLVIVALFFFLTGFGWIGHP